MPDISISVIISTYNSPDYLRRVLEGYRAQSRYPDELIVADDGSTEETTRVVKRFAATAPFVVRHAWHEDRGFRKTVIHNKAIAEATSDYIIFSDGDCIPHPSFIEDHGRALRRGYFVTGKRMLVGRELSPHFNWTGFSGTLLSCLRGKISGCHHLIRLPWLVIPKKGIRGVPGCNLAMFRSDLLSINGFNEAFTGWGREDSELVIRLFNSGVKRLVLPFAAIVYHLWHRENDRSSLPANDQLLAEAMASGRSWCRDGIVKGETKIFSGCMSSTSITRT